MVSGEDYPNRSIEILVCLLNGRSPGSDLLEVYVSIICLAIFWEISPEI